MARWVYQLGQWIDNHMPRDTGEPYGWQHDWYHPTVDLAISSSTCSAVQFRVGFWDDFGGIAQLQIFVNDIEIATIVNQRNGSIEGPLAGLTPQDSMKIIVKDFSNNRQMYEKSVNQFISDCQGPSSPPTQIRATQALNATP